jgi:hypothetical protein
MTTPNLASRLITFALETLKLLPRHHLFGARRHNHFRLCPNRNRYSSEMVRLLCLDGYFDMDNLQTISVPSWTGKLLGGVLCSYRFTVVA